MSVITSIVRKTLSKSPTLYIVAGKIYHQMLFVIQAMGFIFSSKNVDIVRAGSQRGLKCFSQYGQELYLLDKKLIPETAGFFIEIGANDPQMNSNTYLLEIEKQYRGISVDPLNYSKRWELLRPNTKFLNCAVSNRRGPVSFTKVKGDAGWEDQLSGISDTFDLADKPFETEITTVECISLRELFEQATVPVDVLFVDVEGHEMQVMQSNDWIRYKPKIIVCENCGSRKDKSALRSYLAEQSYRHIARIWLVDDIFILKCG